MRRWLCMFVVVVWATVPARAGIPPGITLMADEQTADEATGVTIARGNAEITTGNSKIVGRADTIELRPALNEILLKGRAVLTVGRRHYESDAVSCTLDFVKCTAITGDQDEPSLLGGAAAMRPE